MIISWTAFKFVIDSRSLVVHGTEDAENYYLKAVDGALVFDCMLQKANQNECLADFETNYKPTWNQRIQPTSSGIPINRFSITRPGFHYEPRCINWTTAKYNSSHNKNRAGVPYTDNALKFFNSERVELVKGAEESAEDFQTRLDTDCIFTQLNWQPAYDMDIAGGELSIDEPPNHDVYLWVTAAPDLEPYGLSVPFFNGGLNLKMLKDLVKKVDGRSPKQISYDPVYNSNKFSIFVEHQVGDKIALQIEYQHFKA